MSEHSNGSGTEELDATFGALVEDVSARSRRPGADLAVRTAGRRRAASATAAVVAVLALAVGGGWALQDHASGGAPVVGVPSASGPPTSTSTSVDEDPAAGLMSLQRLNAASKGWVTWQEGPGEAKDLGTCPTLVAAPAPSDVTTQQYRADGDSAALLQQFRFASAGDSNLAMRAAVEAADACTEGSGLFTQDFAADLEVVGITWRSGSRSGAVWLVNHGDRMDVFRVAGPPRPSDDTWFAVAEPVAADVQVP